MDGVVRAMWLGRAWTGIPLLTFAIAAALGRPSPVTAGALLVVIAALALAALATRRLGRALIAGDRGELLFKSGARVPAATWRAAYRSDLVELWTGVTVGAGVGGWLAAQQGLPSALLAGFGALVVLLQGLIWVQRRWSNALIESLASLIEGDLARAEQALAPAARANVPTIREAAKGMQAHILLRQGRSEAARRQLEQGWNGAIDDRAALLGWLALGAGDPGLAERWLAAPRPDRRYERYLEALLGGGLCLHLQDWDGAIARTSGSLDLPEWYLRQLRLIEAAALQGAGRTEQARAALAALGPLTADRWLSSAVPLQWRLLEDAQLGRPTASRSLPHPAPVVPLPAGLPPADPFAPPQAPGRAQLRARARWVGAIPVEGLPLSAGHRAGLGWLRTILGALLLVLGALLIALSLALSGAEALLGDPVSPSPIERLYLPFGLASMFIGALLLGEQLLASSSHRSLRPAVALSDGRRLGQTGFAALGLLTGAPLLVGVPLLLAAPLAVPPAAVVTLPLAILLLWSFASRIAALRVVRSVHFDRPSAAVRRAEWAARRSFAHGDQLRLWLCLARLWDGDGAGAEREIEGIATLQPELAGLRLWFQAARGGLELDRALAEPEPEALGDRYRWAVALALAALHSGRPDRVSDRVPGWIRLADALPSRFGALLGHLARRIGEGSDPDGPVRGQVAADPDLAWIDRVWPFVNRERR